MKLKKPSNPIAASLTASLAAFLLGGTSASAQLVWNSAGPSNSWSTDAGNENWTGNVVWTPNSSALFDGTSGAAEALDVSTSIIFNDITFDVTGFSISGAGAGSLVLADDLASTITVTTAGHTATISETIADSANGASSLTKAGLGSLTLSPTASSTYTGGTTVSSGNLTANFTSLINPVGTGTVSVANGATLVFNNTSTANVSPAPSIANTLTGSGLINLNFAAGTTARNTTVPGLGTAFNGTFQVSSSGTTGDKWNAVNINAPGTAVIINSGNQIYLGGVPATLASLSLVGTGNSENRGALRLQGAAGILTTNVTLVGNTTIGGEGGSLVGNITSGTASAITLTLGTTASTGGATLNGVVGGGLGDMALSVARGTYILGSANTYTGKTSLGAVGAAQLNITSFNSVSGGVAASSLGAPTSVANGTIDLGSVANAATIVYTGPGETTDRVLNLSGTTGGATLTNNGTGLLKFNSDLTATGAGNKTLTVNGSANTEIAGAIVNSTGTTGLTKAGAGTLTLSGNNSFTGNVSVQAGGVLRITHNNALGSSVTGNTTVTGNTGGNGRLELTGGITSAEAITLEARQAATLNIPAISNVSGDNTLTGLITGTTGGSTYNVESQSGLLTLSGGFTLTTGATGNARNLQLMGEGNGVVSGVIFNNSNNSGFPSVVKQGSGTWTLSGANTYSGNTTVTAGTLVITGNQASSGATLVNGGTLRLDYGTNDTSKLADAAALTLGGGTLELTGGSHTEAVGSTTLTAGTTSTVTASGATLQLNTVTANSGATVLFGTGSIASTDNANINGILPWARVWNGSSYVYGTNSTNLADGPIVAFTGYSDIVRNGGVIPNGLANHIRITDGGTTGNVTLAANPSLIGSLLVSATGGSTTVDLGGGTLSVGDEPGGIIWLADTAGALTLGSAANNGTLTTGNTDNATAAILTLQNDSPANALTINATLTNNGTDPVALVTSGVGTVILNGTNTYGGGTTLASGSLSLGNASAVGTGTLALNGGTLSNTSGAALSLTANNAQTWGGNFTFAGPNDLDLGTGAVTLTGARTVNVTSSTLTVGGAVSGAFALTKSGTGSLVLSGINSYTGATTVNAGSLTLGNGFSGAAGTISVSTAGQDAILNINGGTYAMGAGQINVGNSAGPAATATVNQTGGAISFASGNGLLVGQNVVGNKGVYNLSGGSITSFASTARGIMLGVNSNPAPGPDSGGGTFNLSGTGVINLTLASGATGDGLLEIGRSDSVANNTTNAFNQTGGTANVGILTLGGAAAGSTGVNATLNLTGGVFSANQFTVLGAGGTNTCVINIGGTADVTLPAFPTARGAGSTATLNFDGGTLKPLASSGAYLGGLTNAFIKAGGARFNTNGFDITVSQNLLTDTVSTGGGLTKDGTGTLTLTGVNTYTGNTTVSAGTLSVSNASFADASTVSVATGAVLNLNFAGTDTVASLVLNGVVQAPGVYDSTHVSGLITGTGSLTVPSTGPSLAAFNAASFTTEEQGDPLVSGPTADPDNDGVINALEYAFSMNPKAASRANLPVGSTSVVSGSTFVGAVYTRVKDATDLTFTVQFSNTPDAAGFTNATAGVNYVETIQDNGTTETVTIRDLTPVTAGNRRFVRILVTYP